jgi:hypothetical protein
MDYERVLSTFTSAIRRLKKSFNIGSSVVYKDAEKASISNKVQKFLRFSIFVKYNFDLGIIYIYKS